MLTSATVPSSHDVGKRIRAVLDGDALSMVFQPVVDLRTGQVVGCESLARFQADPRRTPDLWFGEAWSVGLGLELELKAIRVALASLRNVGSEQYIAINTAPATLSSQGLHDVLASFPATRIVVELTEHERVDDYEALIAAIGRLRALGARLSIDDAGAGFSSFQHVLRLRPDIIKLDRSLTTHVDDNPVRAALAAALVTFAASLGARICAEGIETIGELVALQKLGIAYGQGYLLARPAPLPLADPPPGLWTSRVARRSEAGAFMPSPAVRDGERLDALRRTELMDSPPEDNFDKYTRVASTLLGVPVSLVSLVDDHRQFFKSVVGLTGAAASTRETPLTHSFCQHAVTTRMPLVVDDARVHPLVHDNGAVADLGVIAYAGAPIITSDHHALGALCVVDDRPRTWSAEQVACLTDLAAMLATEIDLRRIRAEHRDQEALFRRVFDQTNASVLLCRPDGYIEHVSSRLCKALGYDERELRGRTATSLEHADDAVTELTLHNDLLTGTRNEVQSRKRWLRKDGDRMAVSATTSVIRDASGKARFTIITVESVGMG